ncbi:MAG: phosphatidylserine decarboxylase family protein [Muribaculaceae bacterium]|nr:phosphatidylserine decarboxylase family protein [Muribaculaceae bacterium]
MRGKDALKYKIHREGTNILIMLAVVLLALNIPVWLFLPPWILPSVLSALSVLVYSFVFNFFRCPARRYKGPRKDMVVSSVDGGVVVIERTMEHEFIKGEALQISVFMSPLNVHANWFPVEGRVAYVRHHAGRFYSAWLPKASTENERSTIGIVTPEGHRVTVRQVAGAMARRIVTYARVGEEAEFDEHLGFIKFGSRVDIYLPVDSVPLVRIGQRVVGDQTQLATLPGYKAAPQMNKS